jgi:hypothetical protein
MSDPLPVLLAAPGGYFSKLGNTFHQEGAIVGWEAAGIIVGAAATIIGLAWLTMRLLKSRQKRISHCPWRLFKDLCAAHELTYRERQLLTQLAHQHRLQQPAMLFVEPAWWDAERLGSGWQRSLAEVQALHNRLFATR